MKSVQELREVVGKVVEENKRLAVLVGEERGFRVALEAEVAALKGEMDMLRGNARS